jgi:hypothetical protein
MEAALLPGAKALRPECFRDFCPDLMLIENVFLS